MEIKQSAVAGTMESSDIMITLEKNDNQGIQIDLKSNVEKQYGDEIKKVISETLNELGIQNADIKAVDKGALDCVIRARTKTVVYRAAKLSSFPWGGGER